MTFTLRSLSGFLGVVMTLGGVSAEAQEDAPTRRNASRETKTVSVRGTGKITAAPYVADVTAGVVSRGKTAREAMTANTEAVSALLEALKKKGIASTDVQTTTLTITPQYSQPRPGVIQGGPVAQPGPEFIPRIVGYEVQNMVQVTTRDLKKLGDVLDAMVQAGANQMHGISFGIDEADTLLDQARKKAMADAKRKAQLMTDEAGVVLGLPIRISDQALSPRPMVFEDVPRAAPMMMAGASAPVPVSPGEQELSVTVEVTYEMQHPK